MIQQSTIKLLLRIQSAPSQPERLAILQEALDDGGPLFSSLSLVDDIRAAVGDPKGKLMQDDLVEKCKEMRNANDAAQLDKLRSLECYGGELLPDGETGVFVLLGKGRAVIGKTFGDAIDSMKGEEMNHIETLKWILARETSAHSARIQAREAWLHMKDPGSPRCKYSKKQCAEMAERELRIAEINQSRIAALTDAIAALEAQKENKEGK